MDVLVIGYDGFTGYPLAQYLLDSGYSVYGIDDLSRRERVSDQDSNSVIPIAKSDKRVEGLKSLGNFRHSNFDISNNDEKLGKILEENDFDCIVNLAQIPSAPYSMKSFDNAFETIKNNLGGHLNVLWNLRKKGKKKIPLVHLGTMGEWGQGVNMPIPEGFFKAEYEGYEDIIPFPRQTGSVYHSSKAMMSDLSWFACRIWELRNTDIHQGIIFGTRSPKKMEGIYRTRLDQDECFGTVINRFVLSAVKNYPLPIYGSGEQTRAVIPLRDSIRAIKLLIDNPPTDDDSHHSYRVVNQFTDYYSINDIADIVQKVGRRFGLDVTKQHIPNPRIEDEVHFYQPQSEKLDRLGFESKTTLEEEVELAFEDVIPHKDRIEEKNFIPKVKWREG